MNLLKDAGFSAPFYYEAESLFHPDGSLKYVIYSSNGKFLCSNMRYDTATFLVEFLNFYYDENESEIENTALELTNLKEKVTAIEIELRKTLGINIRG